MFETLPGFREFLPEAFARQSFIFETWSSVCERFGFHGYSGPVLEPLELYTEKSGEEIVGQLFNFQDKGGRAVAMRPEMTPTLARLVGARANSLKKPVKWYAIAENFRYERPQKGRLRSHFQLNADIYGEAGPAGDAELLALLISVFEAFGLDSEKVKIRLSDRNLWLAFLKQEGLEEPLHLPVMGVVDKMERTPREKSLEQLERMVGDRAEHLFARIGELSRIRDLDHLRSFFEGVKAGSDLEERLASWQVLLDRLTVMGYSNYIRVDLGIVRGLAYYTGFVFEAFEATGAGRALAGGGRYDHLVKKLGGPDTPAVGFGFGDVTLADTLEQHGLFPTYQPLIDLYIVSGGSEVERDAVLKLATSIRRLGFSVEYSLRPSGFGKQFKEANQKGARFVVTIGEREIAQGELLLKNMNDGSERRVGMEALTGGAIRYLGGL